MRDSLEQFSWNMCADPSGARIVFTAIPKKFCGAGTYDRLMEIFSWSMIQLLHGKMPSVRHDGADFTSSDASRKKLVGKAIPLKAVLVQVRGDWAFYKGVFNFPAWSNEMCCWLCRATKGKGSRFDIRLCSDTASWRYARYKPGEFELMLANAQKLSPLFKSPGLEIAHFMIDWLHCADLGVSQTILGNVLFEALDILWPGLTHKEQIQGLWMKMKTWYSKQDPPSRLDGLTYEMLKLPGKGPKLRSKAAECRYLLPFGVVVAKESNTVVVIKHLKCCCCCKSLILSSQVASRSATTFHLTQSPGR